MLAAAFPIWRFSPPDPRFLSALSFRFPTIGQMISRVGQKQASPHQRSVKDRRSKPKPMHATNFTESERCASMCLELLGGEVQTLVKFANLPSSHSQPLSPGEGVAAGRVRDPLPTEPQFEAIQGR